MFWRIRWSNPRPTGLQREEEQLLSLLSEASLSAGNDSAVWRFSSDRAYSMNSFYKLLADGGLHCPMAKNIWKSKVLLKVQVFTWLALNDRILTYENLQKRNWLGFTGQLCSFCGRKKESTYHLLLRCPLAESIWVFFLKGLGIRGFLGSLKSLWTLWRKKRIPKNLKPAWDFIFAAVCWGLWKQRNQIVFNSNKKSHWWIIRETSALISSWVANYGGKRKDVLLRGISKLPAL